MVLLRSHCLDAGLTRTRRVRVDSHVFASGATAAGSRPHRARSHAFRYEGSNTDDNLAREFAAHLNQLSLKAPLQHRRPSPLDPPTAAVAAQLDALQINDWPEPDAGVLTALAFAKPYECEQLLHALPTPAPDHSGASSGSGGSSLNSVVSSSSSSSSSLVRSWSAAEEWLSPQQFAAQLHSPPYDVLLGCDSWRAVSNMVFPATRVGQRAVQAVEILALPRKGAANTSTTSSDGASSSPGSSSASSSSSSSSSPGSSSASGQPGQLQHYTFTFCLELITQGPYNGCWMTVGVRPGNYSV